MPKRRWKKFFSYYKPHVGKFSLVLFCSLVAAAIELIFPLFAQHIADTSFGANPAPVSNKLLWAMLGLAIVELAVNYYKDIHGHAVGAEMENELRAEFYDHLQKLPYSFYDRHPVGDLMSRLTGDLLELSELYHHGPEDYVVNSITCIGAVVILLTINVPLALLLLAFIVVLGVWTYVSNDKVGAASDKLQAKIGDINAFAEDTLQGVRTVQSFGAQDAMRSRFGSLAKSFYDSRVGIYRAEGIAYQVMALMGRGIRIAVFFVGGLLAVSGKMNAAGFVAFLLYVGYLIEPVRQLAWMSTQFHRGVAGFNRVMDILETQPEIADAPGAKDFGRVQGDIALEDVRFSYGKDLPEVLSGVSLKVPRGKTYALVGVSGVGKTTLLSLLPRFYDPQTGSVKIDGRDAREYTLENLRANIAVVRQDVALFAGTVAENIAMGRPGATREEIIAAAKLADADDFISVLPGGYDSDIGPHGVRLSGGQKQRLSIARAFLKNAPVLLLDEATSSLDSESEARVQKSIERLCEGRTTIIVAHRLSTIRSADCICVLSGGKICEQGTHEQLMDLGGEYANLYRRSFDF